MLLLLSTLSLALADPDCDALLEALDAHRASADHACGTPTLRGAEAEARTRGLQACLSTGLAARHMPALPGELHALPVLRAGEAKLLRDGVAVAPHVYETENFVVRWGSDWGTFTEEDIAAVGEAFEVAWQREVVEMGYPQPIGTDTYKMNVYIGDSGPEVPSADGAGGYAYADVDGVPYVVMWNQIQNREYTATTVSHEFFHTIQDTIGSYEYIGQGAWYFEATAVWMQSVVQPDDTSYADFLFGWAFMPELPINYFDYYNGSGSITEYHQYAAGVFIRYLSDEYGGEALIADSWTQAPPFGDPLVVLDGLLTPQGSSVSQAYQEFAARSATWDFPDGLLYASVVTQMGGWNSTESSRPTGRLLAADAVEHGPGAAGPGTFGTNYWALGDFLPDPVTVRFQGSPGPQWSVTVATRRGTEHEEIPMPLTDGAGFVEVADVASAGEAWVVVSAAAGPFDDLTRYRYKLSIDKVPLPTVVEEPKRRCGCATDAPEGGALVTVLVGLVGLRRRTNRRAS